MAARENRTAVLAATTDGILELLQTELEKTSVFIGEGGDLRAEVLRSAPDVDIQLHDSGYKPLGAVRMAIGENVSRVPRGVLQFWLCEERKGTVEYRALTALAHRPPPSDDEYPYLALVPMLALVVEDGDLLMDAFIPGDHRDIRLTERGNVLSAEHGKSAGTEQGTTLTTAVDDIGKEDIRTD